MLPPQTDTGKMADYATLSTHQLFNQWRTGDAQAGQAMAQRFSDWYYAVTTCRLGEAHGRAPLHRACVRFQQGILSVGNATELTEWAHGIVAEEIKMAGGRVAGGDTPSALTQNRSPSDLLSEVALSLPPADMKLLAQVYDTTVAQEEVVRTAEALGGYPLAVLRARYAMKRALRDQAQVPFSVVPDEPRLDAAPLPLYEAGRMTSAVEEGGFEKWMLTDMVLCKDIAEFGVFAQALRAGALRRAPEAPEPAAAVAPDAPPVSAPVKAPSSKLPLILAAIVVLGLVSAVVLGVAWTIFR